MVPLILPFRKPCWATHGVVNTCPSLGVLAGCTQNSEDAREASLESAISARRAAWLGGVAGGLFVLLVVLFLWALIEGGSS